MDGNVIVFRDEETGAVQHIDLKDGTIRDDSGKITGHATPAGSYRSKLADERTLAACFADLHYRKMAREIGGDVSLRTKDGSIGMTDESGDEVIVKMDLGSSDVHQASPMGNYQAGYRLADGCADLAMPVLMVGKDTDKYYTWSDTNAFQAVTAQIGSDQGAVPEVSPTLSNTSYTVVPYALGAFVPNDLVANADGALVIPTAFMRLVDNKLRLARELRVASKLTTTGNWNSNNCATVVAGAKWNGGASSDPILDLHTRIENSALPVTHIIMPEKVSNAFLRNSKVQDYLKYKDGAPALPMGGASDFASRLGLPPIIVARQKYKPTTSSAMTYVWGNDVVLLHQEELPPRSGLDVATGLTYRWLGGNSPDGSFQGGMMVRKFFVQDRGGRGGEKIVMAHNDIELITSNIVGGLIKDAYQ